MNDLLSALLYPLSFPYGLLVGLDRRFTRAVDLARPVISVGNITWGGTGKTPVVIRLARQLAQRGYRVCVLSRGYRRKVNKGILIVSDGKSILSDPAAAGDEPFLIARSLPDVSVVVGPDRTRAAATARERLSPDVFILDDGFQCWKVKRDLDIVCVNAADPFGNGRLLPAGILREPPSALSRAGLIVLTNSDVVPPDTVVEAEGRIAACSAAPVLRSGRRALDLRCIIDEATDLLAIDVIALSAVGDNESFKKTLEQNGMNIVRQYAFRDHHWFSLQDLRTLLAENPPELPVVTTTKDAVRLAMILATLEPVNARRFFALETELYVNGEDLWEKGIRKAVPFF